MDSCSSASVLSRLCCVSALQRGLIGGNAGRSMEAHAGPIFNKQKGGGGGGGCSEKAVAVLPILTLSLCQAACGMKTLVHPVRNETRSFILGLDYKLRVQQFCLHNNSSAPKIAQCRNCADNANISPPFLSTWISHMEPKKLFLLHASASVPQPYDSISQVSERAGQQTKASHSGKLE